MEKVLGNVNDIILRANILAAVSRIQIYAKIIGILIVSSSPPYLQGLM